MSGARRKSSAISGVTASRRGAAGRPISSEAYSLISEMLEYESAAARQGVDFAAGRFSMLTSAEREFCRAQLIADYIRLCATSLSGPADRFAASLEDFCSRICDMQLASHELIGTFLAAADILSEKGAQGVAERARSVMMSVLRGCTRVLAEKSKPPAAVAS